MKRKGGTRGAISVFLTIILVPCIVISSVFVDLSRVHLSKLNAQSSADLALNTLLTNYDADLRDWYGMVASCQNIDEFYEISAEYFLRALSSQGMSDDEIDLLSDYYANVTRDDSVRDLLRLESKTSADSMISAVDGADLSNAAMIKKQVVEFMKYRAPIEITTNLIERFKNDKTVEGALEAKPNEPLVNQKQKFYETEGKLVEKAYESYKAINAYFTYAQDKGITEDQLLSQYQEFETIRNTYQQILVLAISNLSNTEGLSVYHRPTLALDKFEQDGYTDRSEALEKIGAKKETVNGEERFYIELKQVETLVQTLSDSVEGFEKAKQAVIAAGRSLMTSYNNPEVNSIQWWVRMNQAVNPNTDNSPTKKLSQAAEKMLRAYTEVHVLMPPDETDYELRGELPEEWESLDAWREKYGADSLVRTVEGYQEKYLTAGMQDSSDGYLKTVYALERVSSENQNKIHPDHLSVEMNGHSLLLSTVIAPTSERLQRNRDQIQGAIDLLTVAIDGEKPDTPSLDSLTTYVRKYDTHLGNWKDLAHGLSTKMAEDDRAEIEQREQTIEMKQKDLDVLKTRLTNIKAQLTAVVNAIDSLKWGGSEIRTISELSDFLSKAGIDNSQISLYQAEIEAYAEQLFSERFAPDPLPTMEHQKDSAYNPEIDPEKEEVNPPALWVYFYNKYKGSEGELEKYKSEKNKAQSEADTKKDEIEKRERYHGGGKDVPWEYSGEGTTGSIMGLVDLVGKLCRGDLSGMRDDLYATTYVMEMFSHGTYEQEGRYGLLSDADKKLTLQKTQEAYEKVMGEKDKEKTWLSEAPRDHYNKSMTNHLINQSHNAAYGAEVEYILCGSKDSTNKDNVKAVYQKIYTVRYGLNLVSGFQHFWALDPVAAQQKNQTAFIISKVAFIIQSTTGGMIPAAVTETVLIPILTIFETGKDLDRLEAGFPVELYKAKAEHWWLSLESEESAGGIGGFMEKLASQEGFGRKNQGNGLFYSDYLTLFVYLGFSGSGSAGMYQRMAEVIQFNIGTMAQNSKYSLKNAKLYFRLNSELQTKPLMITLPYFKMDEYKNDLTEKTDWCTFKISTVRGYN